MNALQILLAGIVDYAGLFPPAALDMTTAVRNYAAYRADDEAWMLGRFVVPVARLDEFGTAHAALGADAGHEWRLSALLGTDAVGDIVRARAFNDACRGRASIDVLEGKFTTPDGVERAATAIRGDFVVFVEIPTQEGGDVKALLGAIKRASIHAKIRTGGVTADAIPSPEAVVRVIRRCLDADIAFKATAGLHHPLRADYPLTYDTGAPTGVMFGYLNVFLAAAFMATGMPDAEAVRLLEERSATSLAITPGQIAWNGSTLTIADVRQARERVAISFGSCSFREPVDELRSLTLT